MFNVEKHIPPPVSSSTAAVVFKIQRKSGSADMDNILTIFAPFKDSDMFVKTPSDPKGPCHLYIRLFITQSCPALIISLWGCLIISKAQCCTSSEHVPNS